MSDLIQKGKILRNQADKYHTYSYIDPKTGKRIFIMIDMLHAYVNIFKPKVYTNVISMPEIEELLDQEVWVYEKMGKMVRISPLDALENRMQPEVEKHLDLTKTADTSYPLYIIQWEKNQRELIDGYHRLLKIYDENKDNESVSISYILFDKKIIKKCEFEPSKMEDDEGENWFKGEHFIINDYQLIEKFYREFCKKK